MRTRNTKKRWAASDDGSDNGSDNGSDKGSALAMVLVGMTVLAMFATVSLTYSTQTLKVTRHTQDSIAALAAAQGGVDEYIARLNQNDYYWQTVDCDNPAMQKPWSGANPCPTKWTDPTKVGWAVLPGDDTTARYHYDVDATATPVNGSIHLTSTGKSNKLNRTIDVTLRRGGFGEFLYYTDYETVDPANEATYGRNNATAFDKCAHYFWEPVTATSKPRPLPAETIGAYTYCRDIKFSDADVINGPTHSNDAIFVDGTPEFKGTASTSWPQCRPVNDVAPPVTDCYRWDSIDDKPDFARGIVYKDPIALPTSIVSLREHVAPTLANPGCLYTGPTRIKFLAPAVAGGLSRMQVWSPHSKAPLNAGCGDFAGTWPQTLNIPNNNIIIVQDVPSTQTIPLAQLATNGSCLAGSIGGVFPQSGDINERLTEAQCTYGNVYVEGELAGKVTVSADNNIIITDDLEYSGGINGTDVLGLIANNSVKVYHPVSCSNNNFNTAGKCTGTVSNMSRPSGGVFRDPTVQAAILTLQHSFGVQYYANGTEMGNLNLFGSFSQKYRGPVGTFNPSTHTQVSGYVKNYVYDTRLRYASPPYFLDPVHAAWGVKTFGELAAKYQGS